MKTLFLKKKDYAWALVFFISLVSIVFFRIIINQQTFFSNVEGLPLSTGSPYYEGPKTFWDLDPTNYMHFEVPQTIYWAKELRKGHFALWNPYQGNGQPLSASITSGIYNPLKLILFGALPHWKTFDFYLLLKFLIAGLGTYLFLKKVGLSQRASLLGGVAYMFSGYFVAWTTHWSLSADMMTPWIFLAIECLIGSPGWTRITFLAAMWAIMVLSGNPEAVIVISIFSFLYFVYRTYGSHKSYRTYIYFAIALAIALVICSPMLWDFGLFFSQSINGHNPTSTAMAAKESGDFVVRIGRLLHLPAPLSLFPEINSVFPSHRAFGLTSTYIGIFILLLIAFAFSAGKNKFRARIIFFGAAILFFILIWMEMPPVSWIKYLPILRMVIFSRYCGVFYFSLAVLSAIGFENLKNQNISLKKFWLIIFLILTPLISALAFWPSFRRSYQVIFNQLDLDKTLIFIKKFPAIIQVIVSWLIREPYFYAVIIFGLTTFFFFLFLYFWWKKYYNLIFIFLILEMVLYMPKLRDTSNFQNPYQEPPFVSYLKSLSDLNQYRVYASDKVLMSQTATGYELRNMSTFEGVLLRSYLAYLKPKDPWGLYYSASAESLVSKEFLLIFNLASVKYIISEKALPENVLYKLIYDQEVKIYENKHALPLARIETTDGKILNDVVIEKHEPNKVALKTHADQDGILVLSETNFPGWSAYVDGQKREIETVHETFRGVPLTKGNHKIIFKYWPLFTADTFRAILNR